MSRLSRRPVGNVTLDDAAGEALGDRGLADTGLADQHRVVLRAPAEHLDDAADLLVASDDRVELALARVLGEVAAVALERLVLLLGVLARDAVRAAHLLQRVEHRVGGDAEAAQQVADAARHLRHREQHVLGREVVVAEVAPLLVGRLEQPVRVLGDLGRRGGLAVDLGQLAPSAASTASCTLFGATPTRSSTRTTTPSGWPIERVEQVLRSHLAVVLVAREGLGGTDGLLALAGELVGVERHVSNLVGRVAHGRS